MSNRNKLKEDKGMSTISCIFGSCCGLAVKQRRYLNIILISVAVSVVIYGMLLVSG